MGHCEAWHLTFNDAKSFEELFKIRPDWSDKKLLEKNRLLNNSSFELGKIPNDLPKEDLFLITNYLKQFLQSLSQTSKKKQVLKNLKSVITRFSVIILKFLILTKNLFLIHI